MSGKAIKDGDRSTEPHDTEFSFYEFFAGGGMARAGLGKPWRCLFANDMDPIKASTYIDNWGGEHFDTRDVREIPSNDLPRHADLTWASFPCQDLSLAGNGLGIGDRDSSADEITRSGAVWPFLDLIGKLSEENRKPPLLVLENVLGLLTLDQGRHFAAICHQLSKTGFFASVSPGEQKAKFADFCLERGLSHAPSTPDGKRGRRLFEMLYCEACGDLLLGGQKGQNEGLTIELLPSATNLENLPERPGSEYYDDMTLDEFAVFWPVDIVDKNPAVCEKGWDAWEKAALNPVTGIVTVGQDTSAANADSVRGYLYFQKTAPSKKGEPAKKPSAQPFCCPNCGIDYSSRPVSNRSRPPIRAFRTGVTKSSQLVATELFELLHAIGAEAKSIVFSDSRQDAASMALEIERLHLRDLRREILVATAREMIQEAENEYISEDSIDEQMDLALQVKDMKEYVRLQENRQKIHPPIPISPLHRKKKRRPARRRNTRSPPLKVRN